MRLTPDCVSLSLASSQFRMTRLGKIHGNGTPAARSPAGRSASAPLPQRPLRRQLGAHQRRRRRPLKTRLLDPRQHQCPYFRPGGMPDPRHGPISLPTSADAPPTRRCRHVVTHFRQESDPIEIRLARTVPTRTAPGEGPDFEQGLVNNDIANVVVIGRLSSGAVLWLRLGPADQFDSMSG